jgi:gamma-tubulin complex component 3
MVYQWIEKGDLTDPFGEFFITQNPDLETENHWNYRFEFHQQMLPSYIGRELSNKAFLIGKSLYFIRTICGGDLEFVISSQLSSAVNSNEWGKELRVKNKVLIDSNSSQNVKLECGDLKQLEISIDKAYKVSSVHLLSLFFDKFKLMDHLKAIKKYLLLAQGDFCQSLMDSLGWNIAYSRETLSKPAVTIYRHNLTGTLESAIRSSNAQYENTDILKRLDVRLLQVYYVNNTRQIAVKQGGTCLY